MNTLKQVGAVLVGAIFAIIFSILTDAVLEKAGIFPDPNKGLFITWMLLLATFYRCLYTFFGGYFTAKLASTNPKKLVTILGTLAFLGNLAGLVGTWNMNLGPLWYPIILTILAYPFAYLGGKFSGKII